MQTLSYQPQNNRKPATLVELIERNANLFPEKTAIIYKESKITYKFFYEAANGLASLLLDMGLEKGDRVGILMEKSPEAIIAFMGTAIAGGIVFPLDPNQLPPQMQYVIDLTNPFSLIVDEKFQAAVDVLNLPFTDERIIIRGKKTNAKRRDWNEALSEAPTRPVEVPIHEDEVVYLNFTSGTTGVPKGAVTTHANIFWNTLAAVEAFNLTHDDIHMCMFPVFVHPHELFARPLYLGGTIVLVDSVSPKAIAKAISENGVTCFMAAASIYETLVRHYESSPFDASSMRIPESGGMHTSLTLAQKVAEYFKAPMVPVWGSTEATGIALATPVDLGYRPRSMGKPCPYYEVKVVGDNGEKLPPGEIGEMAIKGPGVCTGYYNNPFETAKCMKDGWFFTGDLVSRDSENYFYFADRRARMMKVAGMKVYPTEIEEVLKSHPDIAEAVVVKVDDRLHGEIPKAIIVAKDGAQLDKNEIRKYCEDRVAKYKAPRVIEFQSELPKTPGGKILWRQLME